MPTAKAAEAKRAANMKSSNLSENPRITINAHEIFKTRITDRLSATDKRKISRLAHINRFKIKQNIFFCTFNTEKEGFLVEL